MDTFDKQCQKVDLEFKIKQKLYVLLIPQSYSKKTA